MERVIAGVTFVAACTTDSDLDGDDAVLGCSVLLVMGDRDVLMGVCPVCGSDEWQLLEPGWVGLLVTEGDDGE